MESYFFVQILIFHRNIDKLSGKMQLVINVFGSNFLIRICENNVRLYNFKIKQKIERKKRKQLYFMEFLT